MPQRVSLIHREQSVGVPADYTLEPGEEFEFASVRAKVNGAGAAAAFVMVLEALSQDGKIITQSPIDQEFAVGDTGALTWAPFLRRTAAATPSNGAHPYARRSQLSAADQVIPTASETNVTLNTFVTDDAAIFEAWDFGTQDGITVKVDGLYDLHGRLWWDLIPGDAGHIVNGIDPDAFGGYPFYTAGTGMDNTPYVALSLPGLRLAAGQDLYLTVYHEFGADRELEGFGGSFFELVRIGDVSMANRDGGP